MINKIICFNKKSLFEKVVFKIINIIILIFFNFLIMNRHRNFELIFEQYRSKLNLPLIIVLGKKI